MNFEASEEVQEKHSEWVSIVRRVCEQVSAVDQVFVGMRDARLQYDAGKYEASELHTELSEAFEAEARPEDDILVSGGSFAYIGSVTGADHDHTKEMRVSNFSILPE